MKEGRNTLYFYKADALCSLVTLSSRSTSSSDQMNISCLSFWLLFLLLSSEILIFKMADVKTRNTQGSRAQSFLTCAVQGW